MTQKNYNGTSKNYSLFNANFMATMMSLPLSQIVLR